MTGVALLVVELVPKRLELVRELVPKATGIGALINPKNSNAGRSLTALQDAAREKGVQLHIVEASTEVDFDKAFESLASLQAGALVVGAQRCVQCHRETRARASHPIRKAPLAFIGSARRRLGYQIDRDHQQ
jgi:putative ABC transport system substrate-binding protein